MKKLIQEMIEKINEILELEEQSEFSLNFKKARRELVKLLDKCKDYQRDEFSKKHSKKERS